MAKFNCFSMMCGYGHKGGKASSKALEFNKGLTNLQVRIEKPPFNREDKTRVASFNLSVPHDVQNDSLNVKVMMPHETACEKEDCSVEVSYEGGDEHEETASLRRDLSDLDLQARLPNSGGEEDLTPTPRGRTLLRSHSAEDMIGLGRSGHISDPGTGKAPFWASPKLKRSCSNLETSKVLRKVAKSPCSGESQELPANFGLGSSPISVTSRRSADRVMLRKHSSSQILPSRSRRLWWKLFLWSHRNLHKPSTATPQQLAAASNQPGGGYSSDTLEPSKIQSPVESSHENQSNHDDVGKHKWDGFQNHWVANAFSVESLSPLARVDKWVQNIEIQPLPEDHSDYVDSSIVYPPSPDEHKSQVAHLSEDILYANSVILSLNSSSTVAHISGTGLKVIPSLSAFTSLRTVNLSNNYIVSIAPGSLPKGLHALNLSRNRINAIEGLRELTRLRVLDLSYNRISRIGQGLSNCTLIKELYLAGNKISNVEGLHRLLKLTVLDVSFNKLTTAKALGQLVANYSSLQALNLLGNPIQTNIGDDQLRKAVYDLLPKLKYLNKQSIKPLRATELATDSVARAALGSSGSRSFHRRKATRRMDSVGLPSSPVGRRSMASSGGGQRSKSMGKSRAHVSKGRVM